MSFSSDSAIAGLQSNPLTVLVFIIPQKINVQFMPHQDTRYSVQVSFTLGCHRVKPVLANYPSLSFSRLFRDCRATHTGKISLFIV